MIQQLINYITKKATGNIFESGNGESKGQKSLGHQYVNAQLNVPRSETKIRKNEYDTMRSLIDNSQEGDPYWEAKKVHDSSGRYHLNESEYENARSSRLISRDSHRAVRKEQKNGLKKFLDPIVRQLGPQSQVIDSHTELSPDGTLPNLGTLKTLYEIDASSNAVIIQLPPAKLVHPRQIVFKRLDANAARVVSIQKPDGTPITLAPKADTTLMPGSKSWFKV